MRRVFKCCLKKEQTAERHIYGTAAEPTTNDNLGSARFLSFAQNPNVVGMMLAICVKCDDMLSALEQRISDAGQERRALSQINGMSNDARSCALRLTDSTICRAIVDDNHTWKILG